MFRYHEDKKFDCDKCDKTFRYLPELNNHMLGHEGKFFLCPICHTSFRYETYETLCRMLTFMQTSLKVKKKFAINSA